MENKWVEWRIVGARDFSQEIKLFGYSLDILFSPQNSSLVNRLAFYLGNSTRGPSSLSRTVHWPICSSPWIKGGSIPWLRGHHLGSGESSNSRTPSAACSYVHCTKLYTAVSFNFHQTAVLGSTSELGHYWSVCLRETRWRSVFWFPWCAWKSQT